MPNAKPAYRHIWTDAEKQLLLKLRDIDKLNWPDIEPYFPSIDRKRIQATHCNLRRKELEAKPLVNPVVSRVADRVIVDRDHRNHLRSVRSDVTANFFGDPLPGYSALDRARAQAAMPPTFIPAREV